jgi:PilZ domain
VDHRLHERCTVNLQATVSDLASSHFVASGEVVDISESGLCAVIPTLLTIGAIVRMEIGDCALFGHVIYCHPAGASFRTGIEVVRVLIGESDLSRVVNNILVDAMPGTPGIKSADSW